MRIVIAGAGLAAQRSPRPCAPTATTARSRWSAPTARPVRPPAALEGDPRRRAARARVRLADVELLTGTRVTKVDRRVHLDTGDDLPYDKVLIATGAEPIRLPGLDHAHTLRTLDDALRLDEALGRARHVAIVGAGLIGQEVASAARARDIAATLIDAAQDPFDALMGPGGGHHLRALHERAG